MFGLLTAGGLAEGLDVWSTHSRRPGYTDSYFFHASQNRLIGRSTNQLTDGRTTWTERLAGRRAGMCAGMQAGTQAD